MIKYTLPPGIEVQDDAYATFKDVEVINFGENLKVTPIDSCTVKVDAYDPGEGNGDDDCDKYTLSFGRRSILPLTTSLLEGSGRSTLGYSIIGDGYLRAFSIKTDVLNDDIYKIKKNGIVLTSTTFNNQDEKIINEGYSITTGDCIQAEYCLVPTAIDIHSAYVPDADTLFLGHIDGDTVASRHITNDNDFSRMCGNIGRLRNGVTVGVAGPFGSTPTAYDFNGYDNWVQMLHHIEYDIQDVTVEMWVKADTTSGTDYIFSKDATGRQTGGHLIIYRTGDDLKVRSSSTSTDRTLTASNVFSTSSWHHVAVVMGTGGFKIFFDGILEDSDVSWTQGLNGNREPLVIGACSTSSSTSITNVLSNFWNGKIAQVRISDTRRYESNFIVPSGAFVDDANMIGLWPFDESSGNFALDLADIVGAFMIQSTGSFPTIVTSPVKIGTNSIKMNNSQNECLRQIHNPKYEVDCFTVEGWVYQFTDGGDGIIFQKGTSETEGGLIVKWLDIGNKLEVTYYGASTSRQIISGTNSFNSFEWHHFAVTASTTELKLWIDGSLVATESLTSDFINVWQNNKADLFWACGVTGGASGKGDSDSDSSATSGGDSDSDSDGSTSSRHLFLQAYLDELRISSDCRDFENGGNPVREISLLIELECCE